MSEKNSLRIVILLMIFNIAGMVFLSSTIVPQESFTEEQIHQLVEQHDQRILIARSRNLRKGY